MHVKGAMNYTGAQQPNKMFLTWVNIPLFPQGYRAHRSLLSDTLPGVVDFMSSESLYSLTDNILFVLLKCTTISIQIYSLDCTKSSGLHPNYSG